MLIGWRRRFTAIYWTIATIVLISGWMASRFIVPGLIESAYAGESTEFLNKIITGQANISLNEYLAVWSTLANRLLVGAGLAAVTGYAVVIWYDRLRGPARRLLLESDPSRTDPSRFVYLGVVVGIIAGAVEAMAVLLHAIYDPMNYSSEVVWMAPVAGALVFGSLGAVFALITLRWSAFPRFEVAVLTLTAVATYGVIRPVFSSVHPAAAAVLALGIGIQAARVGGRRAVKSPSLLRWWTLGMAGLVVAVALVHHGSRWVTERRSLATLPQSRAGVPNILLLILDTVRAQNMSLYGYGRPTTPVLDKLAASAVVFDSAFAPSSWTLSSHGTFFTGHWPSELSADWTTPLDESYPTLAEYLTRHGYVSAGFVANYYYATEYFGLDRGFLHYEDNPVSWPMLVHNTWRTQRLSIVIRRRLGRHDADNRKSATQVNEDFFSWHSKTPKRPYFVFLNYIDAHAPYRPPPPFRNIFSDGDGRYWQESLGTVYTEEAAEEFQAAYDAGIAYMDNEIGVLLAELDRRGELDNTVVIITSDHGEEFGEHGSDIFDHGASLYLPATHVPLLLRLPSEASSGARVTLPVTLRDLPATILDLAGFEESAPFPGTSLRGQWGQDHLTSTAVTSPVFMQLNQNPTCCLKVYPSHFGSLRSILLDGKHYIAWENGREELYDLATDPAEHHDLSDSATVDLQAFREALAAFP